MSDGGMFADYSSSDFKQHVVVRCWKVAGAIDCLFVQDSGVTEAVRERLDALPRTAPDKLDLLVARGYWCGLNDGGRNYQEEIRDKDRGLLTSHGTSDYSSDRTPWTRAFVETYLADNKVQGLGLYLNCAAIGEVINKGSLASIGTTSLTYAILTN